MNIDYKKIRFPRERFVYFSIFSKHFLVTVWKYKTASKTEMIPGEAKSPLRLQLSCSKVWKTSFNSLLDLRQLFTESFYLEFSMDIAND